MHRARQPGRERLPEALETGRGEREQPGAVVRAVEGDDARLARREQRGAERDLDGVLARDAELPRPRQRLTQPLRHLGLGEITERVHDRSVRDRRADVRIAVAERGDAEAGGQVDVLAPVLVPDAAALCPGPDH
jgi:hypothetical protein